MVEYTRKEQLFLYRSDTNCRFLPSVEALETFDKFLFLLASGDNDPIMQPWKVGVPRSLVTHDPLIYVSERNSEIKPYRMTWTYVLPAKVYVRRWARAAKSNKMLNDDGDDDVKCNATAFLLEFVSASAAISDRLFGTVVLSPAPLNVGV
ncbi:hypothetical protein OS493_038759 [Desmophyllum pertusum]|uniref:Uncharacterized protein n=1 Tax=Desmophyllum pertusum TaxID=174260 RepID=A0A9W9Y9X8_9CNID|nr:hypothetical protein OS493_038759 [Desmophyllum pertusum]